MTSKTGNLDWTYGNGGAGNTTTSGSDTVYGHYPTFIDVIADGKVYTGTTEHSPDQPLYKGGVFRCLNATTGEEIWQYDRYGFRHVRWPKRPRCRRRIRML